MHSSLSIYACHICHRAFTNVSGLRQHNCPSFQQLISQLQLDGNDQLQPTVVILVCIECYLQLPLHDGVTLSDYHTLVVSRISLVVKSVYLLAS
jgi:hypothetical protein